MDPQPQPQPQPVSYICRDCGHEEMLMGVDVDRIRCSNCFCRFLYKKRPRKIVMHLAR